jgi:zinc/manganese transport system substrate-binding protein
MTRHHRSPLRKCGIATITALSLAVLGLSCSGNENTSQSIDEPATTAAPATTSAPVVDLPDVVVTYSVLAAVVSELVDGVADVVTIIPDGQDPHDFEPSPRDIELINNAVFVVSNGLDLEEGLDDALANAKNAGVPVFAVADHVTTLDIVDVNDHSDHGHVHPGAESSHDHADHDHSKDPHVWLSPHTMREVLPALAQAASEALGVDLDAARMSLDDELDALDTELQELFSGVDNCQLVTGHNELGYFADRYGCTVIAAILSSASTDAEESAGNMEFVIDVIRVHGAKVVFTSLGTNPSVAAQVAKEANADLVEINTHFLGSSESYVEFIRALGTTIATSLS